MTFKSYRAHTVDRDGMIRGAEIVRAASRDQAMAMARALATVNAVELWDGATLLAVLPCEADIAPIGRVRASADPVAVRAQGA